MFTEERHQVFPYEYDCEKKGINDKGNVCWLLDDISLQKEEFAESICTAAVRMVLSIKNRNNGEEFFSPLFYGESHAVSIENVVLLLF